MDVQEVKIKKKECEQAISDLLTIFSDETGVNVDSIDIDIVRKVMDSRCLYLSKLNLYL